MELILTSFMKNLVVKSFTTGGSTDFCVTFTNCIMIRDPFTYTLKYLNNVPFTTVYAELVHTSQLLKVLRDSLILIFKLV